MEFQHEILKQQLDTVGSERDELYETLGKLKHLADYEDVTGVT